MEQTVDRATAACGGPSRLAAIVGVSAQTVSNWRTRGVPVTFCAAVEAATGNAVRRWDLRPDDWHRIWPELVSTEGAPDPQSTPEAAHG